jgi:hypothetical protein
MTRFLRARRFRTLRLTPDLLVQAKTEVRPDHVLLLSQLFRPGEGTWGVVFEDFYYHNFDAYALSSLSFLNKPILSAYLIVHPKWQISYATKKPTAMPPAKRHQLTLASVRKHPEFTHLRTWT